MTAWKLLPLLLLAVSSHARADEPPKAAPAGTLIVIDNTGKEHQLKTWKFTQGVRHLAWLAKDGEKGAGPEALELREEHSTDFKEGILTLIPLDRLRSLDYNADKESVTVHATGPKGEDVALTGSTAYVGVNKLTIECEIDKGDLGVAAVKFQGGAARGLRGLRFPASKPAAEPAAGREATILAADTEKSSHPVSDLQALYEQGEGAQKVSSLLFFKKTLKIELGKIQKAQARGRSAEGVEWDVTLKDGDSNTLTLLKTATLDGKPATLLGLLGRVPAGYQLFPPATVGELTFDAPKPDK